MSLVEKLLDAYPAETGMPPKLLGEAVDKLYECAGVCLTCATRPPPSRTRKRS